MNKIDLDQLLTPTEGIHKPSRYLGGEWNQVPAEELEGRPFRAVLSYPDIYELGMSHLGLKILLDIGNQLENWAVERVFLPAPEMASRLRERETPLFSLETKRPLASAQVLGFSLQTETTYTNILEILELGQIPWRTSERTAIHPLVIAGGSGAMHPEPLSSFIDLFVLGDGEEAFPALLQKIAQIGGPRAMPRTELLTTLARSFPWVYAPSLYEPEYDQDGCLIATHSTIDDLPLPVTPAVVESLDQASFPTRPLLPWTESTHDRITIEIMRGCLHGCRFCEAGMQRRPLRFREKDSVVRIAKESFDQTGYDEISLLSLSSSDHPQLREIMSGLATALGDQKVGIALPSLRVDQDLAWLPAAMNKVRRTTLTMAPEAATDRLRAVINKDIKTEDLLTGALEAWTQGWRSLKLYFMLGLPTETDEDIVAIAELAEKVSKLRGKVSSGAGKVTVTVSTFVPRPWTPFQWEEMANPDEVRRKQQLLKSTLRMRNVKIKFHHPERSFLEALLGRGDRRVGEVLATAREMGAHLDSWDDYFDWGIWLRACEKCGIDPVSQGLAKREMAAHLPWDHLSCAVDKDWLAKECARAQTGEVTPWCQAGSCSDCGVGVQRCLAFRTLTGGDG